MIAPSTSVLQSEQHGKPVCIIVLGMAGSGKTTFVHRLVTYLNSIKKPVYTVNLDPAVHHVPYSANIDIRDTVKFKEVMKQYGFGPNGAIMTSLNFFASQFHKVIDLIHKNATKVSYVVLDTPGQIEVFTWSASGTIISESLGSAFPTLVVYVMDTPRSHNPVTFMSNMLYACSVLYRMRLPFLVVLNKTDIIDCAFAIEWMRDFEVFQDALAGHRSSDGPTSNLGVEANNDYPGTTPYMLGLMNSMSLVLDEFYNDLRCCGVSSVTGEGMDQLMTEITSATKEYHEVYIPLLQKRQSRSANSGGCNTSGKITHTCSEDCAHSDSEETGTSKLTMEPVGLAECKRRRKGKSMLVDLAGDCDEAEEDALVELDGVEARDATDDEDSDDQMDGQLFYCTLLIVPRLRFS
ncbi:XPA binding protein 1 GTPase [Paragonimus heterotremus]|uniref:GPN-loop GTPase n=1 Tax=Paragonimus heterotremus TaxID=100268 RepID=A0A8J4SX05_9TREM|nr:XPA binding protein 1 GTPase [Paragonimus heterotremus]